jgi:hypothetical protein
MSSNKNEIDYDKLIEYIHDNYSKVCNSAKIIINEKKQNVYDKSNSCQLLGIPCNSGSTSIDLHNRLSSSSSSLSSLSRFQNPNFRNEIIIHSNNTKFGPSLI